MGSPWNGTRSGSLLSLITLSKSLIPSLNVRRNAQRSTAPFCPADFYGAFTGVEKRTCILTGLIFIKPATRWVINHVLEEQEIAIPE